MADFAINPSAANGRNEQYDGRDYEVELSDLPRSRAPSYVSKNSFWNGADDDEESLIHRDRAPSYSDGLKGPEPAVRVVSQTPTVKSNREKRRKLQGWRFGVTISAWTAFTVLMMNLILTIYAAVKYPMDDGVGTAYTGSCGVVDSWTTWLHILINGLSSILLSASNYTMQCLCSPTRQEIDKAHARGDWMDIGVSSVRNIFKINWRRSALWWLLALSSVPIHLLYNSAIFKTLDANEYTVAVVNTDFLNGEPFSKYVDIDDQYLEDIDGPDDNDYASLRNVQQIFANNSAYTNTTVVQNLSNSDCMAAYGTSFVSGHSNLLAITTHQGNQTNNTLFWEQEVTYELGAGPGTPPYFWICEDKINQSGGSDEDCDVPSQRKDAATWTIDGLKIDYCLAQIAPPHCKLQFSLHILLAVILMNAGKSFAMFLTLFRQKDATLVTIGDAMASFLDTPDELTKGRCLMAKVDVDKGPLRWRLRGAGDIPNTKPLPVTYYAPLQRRWFGAASVKRWCVTMGLCLAGLITGAVLLGIGVGSIKSYLGGGQTVFSLGFGAVDSRAIIDAGLPQGGSGGLVSAVLLANLPQAICSFLYLTYNGLFTCMLLCHEYSKYAMDGRKKPLRVTTPRGQQRSTYYLQLPYTYSIPLLVASASLHWFISESIFLARISTYNNGQNTEGDDFSEVGYSCLPILCVILLGTVMLLTALAFGNRKFASHMPVAGSCSVALAAAAHKPKHDEDAAYLPIKWGEVHSEGNDEIGHCCFTSEEVQDLIPGRMYAGSDTRSGDLDDQLHRRRAPAHI